MRDDQLLQGSHGERGCEKTLAIKERELLETKEELKSLQVELGELSAQFEDKSARQRDLKTSAELMASRLSRLTTHLRSFERKSTMDE